MDFTILPPKTANYRTRTFVRYSLRSKEETKTVSTYINKGFYYIGKDPANIEKLVRIYKRGYASENIENAKVELKRSLEQEKNVLPEVIFCESSFDFAAVRNFVQFLHNYHGLSSIPFILDASNLCDIELNLYKKHQLADDILMIGETGEESLLGKVRFLNKVKTRSTAIQNRFQQENHLSTADIHTVLKRGFDILVSLVALLALSPVFLLIALAINIESKGSVFYIAKRAGRGYRIFNFYKFRTMFVGADQRIDEFKHLNQYNTDPAAEGPAFFKLNNDPRITRVGAFLRNSSLDELPQLINVLLGDMSLVGNRPLPLYEAATLTTDQCAQRFMAPAGITGLWQIKKRGREDMSVEERINLDIVYANKYNFMYDLWIMANTPSALIQKSSV
jgi:lipopolysaccharide/colanic/teichoic acid biosynthesis glycosyltransferase